MGHRKWSVGACSGRQDDGPSARHTVRYKVHYLAQHLNKCLNSVHFVVHFIRQMCWVLVCVWQQSVYAFVQKIHTFASI